MSPTVFAPLSAQAPAGFLTAPFQFLMTGEDNLRLSAVNVANVSVSIAGRWLQSGAVSPTVWLDSLTPTSDGAETSKDIPLGAGALLNLTVWPVGDLVEPGQCYVRVDIVRGLGAAALVVGTLISGYIGSWGGRSWPGTPLEAPTQGRGWIHQISGGAPAAGVAPSWEVPAATRWRLIAAAGLLATSATAATRRPQLRVYRSVSLVRAQSSYDQPASQNVRHNWSADATPFSGASPLGGNAAFGAGLELSTSSLADVLIDIQTVNLQADDQWTDPWLLVEEWRNPHTVFGPIGAAS